MDGPFPEGMMASIEQFLSTDAERKRGDDLYPEVFTTPSFFPLQRKRELAQMIQEARKISPRVVYEIGADKGGGLYHWIKCLPTVQRVIACEIRGTPYSALFEKAFPEIDFLWTPDPSYTPKTIKKVMNWLGNDRLDCLFIDGDKSGFLLDYYAYESMLNRPCKVFMHDVTDAPPKEAFIEARERGSSWKIISDTTDSKEAMAREMNGVPVSDAYEGWLRHWKGRSCTVGVINFE